MKLTGNKSIAYYVQKWGNPTSIALFDPECNIFQVPHVDGIIGYRIAAKCAVVFGDPVCSEQQLPELMQAFHDYCKKIAKSIVYVTATQKFMDWAITHGFCQCSAAIGDEIILNPQTDPRARRGADGSSLRNKYTYSVRQGITVQEYTGGDQALEQQLEAVKNAWLSGRKGKQLFLFSEIAVFEHRDNKRYFYAQHEGNIVGLLILNRIDAYQGWVLNMLMLVPGAPTTTSEFLIMNALEILRNEGCPFFSVGTTPPAKIGPMIGLSKFSCWLTRTAFNLINKVFKLNSKQRYWKKFHPEVAPTYIMVSRPKIGIREAMGIISAFNGA